MQDAPPAAPAAQGAPPPAEAAPPPLQPPLGQDQAPPPPPVVKAPAAPPVARGPAAAVAPPAAQAEAPVQLSAAQKSIEGGKLSSLVAVLATQPVEFHQTIIDVSSPMLDLALTIKQRESSHSRFNEQMPKKDADGNPLKDKDGKEIKVAFCPRSLRKKNPAFASTEMNKDSRILNELKRADTLHEKYKSEMTAIVKDISGLEITIRKEKLREQFFDAAKLFAQVHVLIKREMHGDGGSSLSVERLANFAAVQLLPALPIEAIEALYADSANRLK